jgi:hypothetical protein
MPQAFIMCCLLGGCASPPLATHDSNSQQAVMSSSGVMRTSSSSSEEQSWKEYRNEKYAISFQYPSNWEISATDDPRDPGFVVSLTSPETKKDLEYIQQSNKDRIASGQDLPLDSQIVFGPNIIIKYSKRVDDIQGSVWKGKRDHKNLTDFVSDPNVQENEPLKIVKEIPLAGTRAYLIVEQTMGDHYYLLAEHQGAYSFELAIGSSDDLDHSPYREILSSFKFLK